MAVDARGAQVLTLVCEACGFRACTEGDLLCENAKRVGFCTREEYERRHVEERRQRLGAVA